jgi:hypothetical protein
MVNTLAVQSRPAEMHDPGRLGEPEKVQCKLALQQLATPECIGPAPPK